MTQQPITIEGLSPAAAAAVVKLARNLGNSQDMNERMEFYRMAKKADPSVSVPVEVQLEMHKRELAAAEETRETKRRSDEITARLNAQKRALIDSGRYDEATVKRIEDEIMTPKGISDYETAATLFAATSPESNVIVPDRHVSGRTWKMPWDGKSKEEAANMVAHSKRNAIENANNVIAEINRNRKRA